LIVPYERGSLVMHSTNYGNILPMTNKKVKPADYLFWAVKQELPSTLDKLLLCILADMANGKGQCYPTHETLAKQCGCDPRSIIRAQKRLEKQGLIEVKSRAKDGIKTSNLYTVNMIPMHVTQSHNVVTLCQEGGDIGSGGVVTQSHIKHPVLNTQLNTHITPIVPFDNFYSAYPKRVGRAAALKAWEKLNPSPALISRIMQDIVSRVEQGAWCTGQGLQYVPGPAPYLNQQRWEDAIIPRPEFKPKTDYSAIARDFTEI
jgi:hypothetical protein